MFVQSSRSVRRAALHLALTITSVTLGAELRAQQLAAGALPVELTVKPGSLLPGIKVTVAGTLPGYSGSGTVAITITPPQAPPVSVTAKPGLDGKFSTSFGETSRIGKYRVRAVAPDGKGVAIDSFTVYTMNEMAGTQSTTVKQTFALVVVAIDATREATLATPPSPPQQQLLLKLAELEKKFADAPTVAEEFRSAIQAIVDVTKSYPEAAPVVQPLLDELTPMTEALAERLPDIEKLVDGSKKLTQFCDDMVVIEETFTALTWAIGVADKISKTLVNWAIAKGTPAAIKAASDGELSTAGEAALSTAAKTAIKAIKSGKSWNWASSALSALKDVMQYATNEVFGVYCERFQGPVSAKLLVTLNHQGRPYLKYDIELEGKLVANYAREAGVTRIPIKGHIEGNATRFGLSEDLTVLSNMVEMKTGMGRLRVLRFMPPSAPYVEALGMVARMATPAYFNIPVTGEIVGGKLTLSLQPAAIDLTDAINKGKLVMIWVLTGPPFIYVQTATVPLQKAHFILARGIVEPAPQFPITVDSGGDRSVISRRFTRDHKDPVADFRVQFDVRITACNPTCK